MVDPDGGNKYHILGNVLLLLGSQVQRWGNYNSHRRGSAEQLTLTSFKVTICERVKYGWMRVVVVMRQEDDAFG